MVLDNVRMNDHYFVADTNAIEEGVAIVNLLMRGISMLLGQWKEKIRVPLIHVNSMDSKASWKS